MISVEFRGLKELLSTLRDFPPEIEQRVILTMADVAFKSAAKGADRHTKTRALRQSLYDREIAGGRAVGHDPQRAPQALWVNFGTKRHWIGPKDKKALRWPVAGGAGGFAFSKGHFHPGYRGDNYMGKAAEDAVAPLRTLVQKAFEDSI